MLRPPVESGQFRSTALVRTVKKNGLIGSMGRIGACGDNAAMESFFALLQKNVLDRQRWAGRQDLRLAIITWIERTYHRRRRQRRESTEVGAVPKNRNVVERAINHFKNWRGLATR